MKKKWFMYLLIFVFAFSSLYVAPKMESAEAASAKMLKDFPIDVGDLRLSITNVHNGYAGPKFPSRLTPHTNVHVDKVIPYRSLKKIVNFHVTKYKQGSKTCVYVWESEKRKTIIDKCGTSWKDVSKQAANAMKSFSKSLIPSSDWLFLAGLLIILPYILIALLSGMLFGTIASTDEEAIGDYDETLYVSETQPVDDGYVALEDLDISTFVPVVLEDTSNVSVDSVELMPEAKTLEYIDATYSASGKDSLYVSPLVGGDSPTILDLQTQFIPRFTIQNSSGVIVKSGSLNQWARSEEYAYNIFMYRSSTNISTAGLPAGHYRVKILINVNDTAYTDVTYPVLTRHFYINSDRTLNQFSQ